jgi:hypothetical protein
MAMDKMKSEQNAQSIASPDGSTQSPVSDVTPKHGLCFKALRVGVKGAIGLSLVIAGAALAQNIGTGAPQLKPVDEITAEAPTKADLAEAPLPGTKREAIACSRDITLHCAFETETRRNVRQCFQDKYSLISPSCKAYYERVLADEAE